MRNIALFIGIVEFSGNAFDRMPEVSNLNESQPYRQIQTRADKQNNRYRPPEDIISFVNKIGEEFHFSLVQKSVSGPSPNISGILPEDHQECKHKEVVNHES